jgi:dynein heavy chain
VVDKEKIIGNTLLISAYLTYLGPFNGFYRKEFMIQCIEKCLQIGLPVKQDFALRKAIGDSMTIREWSLMGLPTDWVSIDNALTLTNVRKRW